MTQDNYDYRTNSFFLRDQFDKTGKYGIPIISKSSFTEQDFYDLRLIGFDKIKSDQGKHADRMVHFFLYDYKFERVWDKSDADIENLKRYRAVLTPDFSMYTEMPEAMLLYNVFRNRWCGAYFASQGLRVIPTVNFGLQNSFDFCFEGIEKGSVVALSTYMVQEKEGREAQKDFFMAGYNEMLRRLEPEAIICYHEPFPEMEGNIIYVNYELSSWQHMDDDVASVEQSEKEKSVTSSGYLITKYGGYVVRNESPSAKTGHRIVKHTGYVIQLGAGSAYGGNWVPSKTDDERYLGISGEIKHTNTGRYDRDTKIGEDGRATIERHHTDHGNPKLHSNPHDHMINWKEDGSPDPQGQINYWDGSVPVIKIYSKETQVMDRIILANTPEENAFKSIADFQNCMRHHGEVGFTYLGKEYGISHPQEGKIVIYEYYNEESEVWFESSNDLLDYMLEGKKLRAIITSVEVFDRTV